MSAQAANITVTFLREEFATTNTARSFVIVAMVTAETMAAIAKVCLTLFLGTHSSAEE